MSKTNALKRLTMLGAMMAAMMAALPALGQDFYVIKAGDNFLAHTNATTIGNATSFNATTCLWTIDGSNIIAISPDGTTGNTLGYTTSTTWQGYVNGCTLSLAASPANTNWDNATSSPSFYAQTGRNSYTTYYLRYNNGWGMANENTHATVTKLTVSDAPNTSGSSSTTYTASLSGDGVIYSTSGTHTYTADVSHIITYAQTIRTFSGYANSGTTNVTINKPYPVSSAYSGALTNVSWSVSPTTYSTINASTGVLTVTSLPANSASITITYTAQAGGQSVTATTTVMLYKDAATYESSVVILDDREDHSWAYYSDPNCPIRSLNPADVKITYYGNGIIMTGNTDYTSGATTGWIRQDNSSYVGSAKVNVGGDDENTFIYNKTLERTDGSTSANPTGRCAYTTIPNPFQVRPTYGGTETTNTADWAGWRGFQCWRLKSVSGGSVYSAASGGTALTAGAVINGETQIYFAPTSEYGMAVDLEAVWAIAYVVKASDGGANAIGDHSNVGYERNFIVLNTTSASYNFGGTSGKRITNIDRQVTVTRYLPNGVRGQNNDATYVRGAANNYNLTLQANTKFENVAFNMSGNTLTAAGYDLIIGRGCTGTVANVYGATSAPSSSFDFRIESGSYNTSYLLSSTGGVSSAITINAIYGCDYDRAKNTNSNLTFSNVVEASIGSYMSSANSKINMKVLSGTFGSNAANKEFYMGFENAGATSATLRTLDVYGGNFLGGIAGGTERDGNNVATTTVKMRIRGGTIGRYLYGGGQYSETSGTRNIVITGGTFNGWIAGGAYGTESSGGATSGNINLYFGGRASQTNTDGIFGAGYGTGNYVNNQYYYTVQASNVVFADEAATTGSVYGGGNNGFARQNIQVYVAGGHVAGNVFGGANKAPSSQAVAVTVTGGSVDGGVYGGSNQSGAISGQITVDVYGTDPQPVSGYAIHQVFGGGNVAAYSGTPVVTVHDDNSCDISIEEVYGGGNAATVTGTNVTIGGGNKIGNVFGGCYGANVTTNGTKVNVKGGTIGKVFGGNNQSGSITGAIKVRVDKQSTCPMKIGELYGGGNVAPSAVGSIDIGCTGDITAAHATCNETDNRIGYELEGIGDVYGGANAAAVTGNVTLTIDSGMVYRVFGNNNTSASVSGTITVNIDQQDDACGWYVGHVYGGGNKAPYTAPNATPNHPAVNIKNGNVSYHVFGGGLGTTAAVSGNPQVILSGTAEVGGNVYGGGNAAPVSGNTKVTLRN